MDGPSVCAKFFDASALVKVYVDEAGSETVRPYFYGETNKYTTPFCFYETLSVLKGKYGRSEITKDQYLLAAAKVRAWYSAMHCRIADLDFTSDSVFSAAMDIARKTSLDLSDAFQILSVKDGYYSRLSADSKTLLITADTALAQAAEAEGLRVWNPLARRAAP
jgi:predicted nucleic acid-binding protein